MRSSFTGTDDVTGWPIAPKHPCVKGIRMVGPEKGKSLLALAETEIVVQNTNKALEVICHLRLGGEPMVCGYKPGDCPFYGRYPEIGYIQSNQGNENPKQGRLV